MRGIACLGVTERERKTEKERVIQSYFVLVPELFCIGVCDVCVGWGGVVVHEVCGCV